ncbi:small ribosomal subunit protein bS6c alpha [Physcomitrium patens]|uniref:Plastid ribosomal protein S6 n=1 Tax=Physcomitrium patens TaxID=3218 RepID=A0A2K1K2M5_PHYPA|nr:30S ribosomal protein S6 alpha, chloroplastic-like [Physcomitrium patens]PNR48020.1 hypothetical protein PHYPA_012493 [Physcomitrium patens]|eukprot:XP_024385063.1 30S ribosomal protein S6 alpha, chloroplastic-like [Physcomitrella patens]
MAVVGSVAALQGVAALNVSSSSNAAVVSTASSASAMFGCMPVLKSRSSPYLRKVSAVSVRAVSLDPLSGMMDTEGFGEGMDLGQREIRQYPPGLQRYETMTVLRPDITEEQRLALTQRYEESIIAGGGLDVEMFNRGMQPLAYNIKTKNMAGFANRYLDGIYLLFTYVTKPESQKAIQDRLNRDDDIIRSTTFRLKA